MSNEISDIKIYQNLMNDFEKFIELAIIEKSKIQNKDIYYSLQEFINSLIIDGVSIVLKNIKFENVKGE